MEHDTQLALSEAQAATGLITAPSRRHDELVGRLEAYRGQANLLGLADNAGFDRLSSYAWDVLRAVPCDIDEASSLVDRLSVRSAGGACDVSVANAHPE